MATPTEVPRLAAKGSAKDRLPAAGLDATRSGAKARRRLRAVEAELRRTTRRQG